MADLDLLPKSWLSWNFDVMQDGAAIAQIAYPYSWKERASLSLGGVSYQVYREGFMAGKFILEERDLIIADAVKPSAIKNSFEVHYAGRQYYLNKTSIWSRAFLLTDETRELGLIKPYGPFTRKASVSLPDEIPLPVQIFMVWLVLILWKRENDAAAVTAVQS